MTYDPERHHRRSIRLKGYDYSRPGAYFITICTKDRLCLFGEVVNGEMMLTDAGQMVGHWWQELNNKFPNVGTDAAVVMPDHFHGILIFQEPLGTTLRGRPEEDAGGHPHGGSPTTDTPTLGDVVGWFETMTTNAYIRGVKQYGWPRFRGKLWQRSFWDHIVRDQDELNRIRAYILSNPANWHKDEENPEN